MNGKTVEIDNTDAEGRLILAGSLAKTILKLVSNTFLDALYYVSSTYRPRTLIDVATLTGYVISLGEQLPFQLVKRSYVGL